MSAPAAPPAAAPRITLGALCLAAGGAVLFSSKSIFIKLAYAVPGAAGAPPVDAVTLLTLRMLFSMPFFVVIGYFATRRGGAAALTGRDHLALIGLGLIGYYFSSYMDFIGLKYISASLERLILYLYPTFTVLLSALLFRRPITGRLAAALAVCYGGVALVFGHDLAGSEVKSSVWIGGAFVAVSAFTYAVYLVTGTEVIARVGATRFTAYAMTVSSIACIAQFFVIHPLERLALPAAVYGYGLLLGIVSTVLPTFLTAVALKRIGASQVALIGAVGPIATLVMGVAILDESFGIWQLAGAALVITGVLMITIRPRPTTT
ncbi:MAG: DMT family transporter [Burkholderiales bacterium]|nr:DMT family transporter [Burkholderiales bacterium]